MSSDPTRLLTAVLGAAKSMEWMIGLSVSISPEFAGMRNGPPFTRHENSFMHPHIGSAAFQTRDAMGFRALDNLDVLFVGREPGDRVA